MGRKRYNRAPKRDPYFAAQVKKERKAQRIKDAREISARIKATREILAPPPPEQRLIVERDGIVMVPPQHGMSEKMILTASLSDIAAVTLRHNIK